MKKTRPRPPAARTLALLPRDLRWRCTPAHLGIADMEEARPSREIIGQDRALKAIHVGLEMKHYGYNIFVTGQSGTGRTTTIERMLREFEGRKIPLTDKVYVHNFHDPDAPLMLAFPAGKGIAFKRDMASLPRRAAENHSRSVRKPAVHRKAQVDARTLPGPAAFRAA